MPVISGTEGPDTLNSTEVRDEIFALGGNDIVILDDYYRDFAQGPEAFHGGDGDDLFVVRTALFPGQFNFAFDARVGKILMPGDEPVEGVVALFDGFERYELRLTGVANAPTVHTGDGDDIIEYTGAGAGTYFSYGGNDVFYTHGTMSGGTGDDSYHLLGGGFVIENSGEGIDTVYLNQDVNSTYVLPANVERLFIESEPFTRTYVIEDNLLDNVLVGGNGEDTFRMKNGGADQVSGLGGNDLFDYVTTASLLVGDLVDGGAGSDMIRLAGGINAVLTGTRLIAVETLKFNANADYTIVVTDMLLQAGGQVTVDGLSLLAGDVVDFDGSAETDGSFALYGGLANDILRGGAKGDTLDGGGGDDQMAGGAGDDLYVVDRQGDIVIELGGGGTDTVLTSISYTLAAGAAVEVLSPRSQSGTGAIDLVGNGFAQTIYGNNGANLLNGLEGADVLIGLAGNDTYVVDRAEDQVLEAVGGGNDVIFTSVSYSLNSNQEIETLSTQTHAGTQPIDLVGNQLNNTLYGNNGTNLLNGVDGADTMIGLGGNDTYAIDNAGDLVVEQVGGGDDFVFTSISHTLTNGNEVETLSTVFHQGTTAIALGGNDYANHLIGNYGDNYLNGGGGADVMTGLYGNDLYVVDNAGDQVEEIEDAGHDEVHTFVSYTLAANQAVETLSTAVQGGTGAIDLTGNNLNQFVYGNMGTNVLNGGAGTDRLIGFGGADTFAFTTALGGTNIDLIADMVSGSDKIALDDAIFTAIGGLGALNPNAFVIGSAAADGTDRIIYNATTGALFYDADGTGAGAMVQFATLTGAPALAASDFVVI